MSHFHHLEDREEPETPAQTTRRNRGSLVLLSLFLLAYGGFMACAIVSPATLAKATGVGNVAIAWGLGIIGLAFAVSLAYGFLTRKKH